jgi:hypothetical protein
MRSGIKLNELAPNQPTWGVFIEEKSLDLSLSPQRKKKAM